MHLSCLGGQLGRAASGVDQRREPGCGLVRQHVIEPERRGVGIADEAVAGIVGQRRRLGLEMDAGGAERVEPGHVEMRQDLRHEERRGAVAVGGQLDKLVVAVGPRDRLDVIAGGRGEIVEGVGAAEGAQGGDHVLGHFALVEAGPALAGDAAQHLGLARSAEERAEAERLAVMQVEFPRLALQGVGVAGPVEGHARRHRDPGLGVVDRRGEAGGEAEPAPILREPHEGIDGARDRDGVGGAQRHRRMAGRAQARGIEPGRRAARAVQPDDALLAGGLDHHEGVAAEPGHRRLAEPEQHRRRDGGIDRIAAVLQDADRGLGRQRMRGRAHAVQRQDEGSAGLV